MKYQTAHHVTGNITQEMARMSLHDTPNPMMSHGYDVSMILRNVNYCELSLNVINVVTSKLTSKPWSHVIITIVKHYTCYV